MLKGLAVRRIPGSAPVAPRVAAGAVAAATLGSASPPAVVRGMTRGAVDTADSEDEHQIDKLADTDFPVDSITLRQVNPESDHRSRILLA